MSALAINSTIQVKADTGQSSSPTFAINRDAAYYLGSIPLASGTGLLWFDWTVRLPTTANTSVTIQFSQTSQSWNNLVTFTVVNGSSRGQQNIDASWAKPGENYLRAVYFETTSQTLTLTVHTNYSQTLLQLLAALVSIPLVVFGASLWKRGKKWRIKTTR